jgi:hypothetical protein
VLVEGLAAAVGALSAADVAPVDILLATSDHAGHGMFAIVERVINQILLARRIGAWEAVVSMLLCPKLGRLGKGPGVGLRSLGIL